MSKDLDERDFDHVAISSEGLFHCKYNHKTQKRVKKKVPKGKCFVHLRTHCIIEPETTLKDIFSIIDEYKLLKVFFKQYSWCRHIDKFHQEAYRENPTKDPDLKYILITKDIDFSKYKTKKRDESVFDCSMDMTIIGKYVCDQTGQVDNFARLAVTGYSMDQIAHLPIVLASQGDIVYRGTISGNFFKEKLIEKCAYTSSLQDVLDAIYWEISFYGSPEQKRYFVDGVKERLDEYDDKNKDGFSTN